MEKQLIVTVGFLGTGRNYEDLHHAQYDALSVSCCQLEISNRLQAGHKLSEKKNTHTHTHACTDKFAHEHTQPNTERHTHTHFSLFVPCACRCVHTGMNFSL
jgi:hypothetical protein